MTLVLAFLAGVLVGQLAMVARHSYRCWAAEPRRANRIHIILNGDASSLAKAMARCESQLRNLRA